MVGSIEMVNNGKVFAIIFNIRFCVSEARVQGGSGFPDVLVRAFLTCDEVDDPR